MSECDFNLEVNLVRNSDSIILDNLKSYFNIADEIIEKHVDNL